MGKRAADLETAPVDSREHREHNEDGTFKPAGHSAHNEPNGALSDAKAKRLRAILRAPESIQALYRDGLLTRPSPRSYTMPLIAVKYQDWQAQFAYAPPLRDAVINTEEVVAAMPWESRGAGPWTRVRFRDGEAMIIQGTPDVLLGAGGETLSGRST